MRAGDHVRNAGADIAGEAIGSRLEAMFIDVGFGTLDAETLDA